MRLARTLSPAHPDRACDIISESVIDEYLRRDPESAVRLHVSGGRGALFVSGIISSKADFDVGSVVSRTAASLGVRNHIEPFVSIESVPGAFILDATRTAGPVAVTGYASKETELLLPSTVLISRRIAKKIENLRQYDKEWFWLEPSFDITVAEPDQGAVRAYVNIAHGEQDVRDARIKIKDVIKSLYPDLEVYVNDHGVVRSNGLDLDVGASGISDEPYGSAIPLRNSPIGTDPSNPKKFGTWLARGLARRALERTDAKAVMVQAMYYPGDKEPSSLLVRDERGRHIKQEEDAATMTYAFLSKDLRPGLSTNAAHWGFVGEVELPWEGGNGE